MDQLDMLISLHQGYGIGDAVQMTAVLRHVRKYRPHWRVRYRAEEGKHQAANGLCANHFAYGEEPQDFQCDAEVQICLYDTWANWGDRPNTRVSSTLRDCFDIDWDTECGRYQVNISEEMQKSVPYFSDNMVGIHYRGDSAQGRKNLSHMQGAGICASIIGLRRTPLLLDWRGEWPLASRKVMTVAKSFPQEMGRRIDANCAVISRCEAFVGIDSGPGKCAAATDTPSLVVWTGHHPAPFYDPAPNVTHLVPRGYHGLHPVCHDKGVIDWFEAHYNVRQYIDDPVQEVIRWLSDTLK